MLMVHVSILIIKRDLLQADLIRQQSPSQQAEPVDEELDLGPTKEHFLELFSSHNPLISGADYNQVLTFLDESIPKLKRKQ
jgi:hypothetical protein